MHLIKMWHEDGDGRSLTCEPEQLKEMEKHGYTLTECPEDTKAKKISAKAKAKAKAKVSRPTTESKVEAEVAAKAKTEAEKIAKVALDKLAKEAEVKAEPNIVL